MNKIKVLTLIGLISMISFVACDKNDDEATITTIISPLPSFPSEVQIAANEITFGNFTTGINGGTIQAATVEGMLDVAHGTFVKIPIGDETVPHTHSHTEVIKQINFTNILNAF